MATEDKNVTVRVIIDFIIVGLMGIPSLVCEFAVYPFKRGFFCDDQSISHPYHEDTITMFTVAFVGICLPLTVIIVTEVFILVNHRRQFGVSLPATAKRYFMFNKSIPAFVINIYKTIAPFGFGALASQGTTDIAKYSFGRLRPHFLAVCEPDYSKFNCTDSRNFMLYVTEDVCTGDYEHIKEARVSHPSGHASFSAYCMVYLVLYIQSRITWKGSRLLRHFMQVLCMYMTIYTCCSRVSDYKHHWSDVLVGFLLGSTVAILTAKYISTLFLHGNLRKLSDKLTELQDLAAGKIMRYKRDGYGSYEDGGEQLSPEQQAQRNTNTHNI